MTTYEQTIDYLYQRLPVFHLQGGVALKAGLQNITALCEALGNPQHTFKSIHIAGTNGKGSTSHLLSAILQQAGYKTGLHTSPHLKSFTERFKINGQPCDEAVIVEFVETNRELIETISPSFFEISVALAFDYFAKQAIDVAVIEVGLGGRLDSTNIITPVLSVITNISFDHVAILGDTLEKIAVEKAGIIKKNVPVVISQTQSETIEVFKEKAKAESAEIYFADQQLSINSVSISKSGKRVVTIFEGNELIFKDLEIDLIGQYQLKNLLGVLQSVFVLQSVGFDISDTAIRAGIANTSKLTNFKGRWQILQHSPSVVVDVAHNEGGLTEILTQIQKTTYQKLYFVLGFVKDKEVEKILKLFPKSANYVFCKFTNPRAMSIELLTELADALNLNYEIANSPDEGLMQALQMANTEDMIYVGGSTFVVAEITEV